MAGLVGGLVRDEIEQGAGFPGLGEGALFGLGEQAGGFVEIDEAGGGAAVGLPVGDGALENIEVPVVVRAGGFGMRDVQDLIAELGEEERVVRLFRTAGFLPTLDETGNDSGRGVGHGMAGGSGSETIGRLRGGKWKLRR